MDKDGDFISSIQESLDVNHRVNESFKDLKSNAYSVKTTEHDIVTELREGTWELPDIKKESGKYVVPFESMLRSVLTVNEKDRWISEQEQGRIDRRGLVKLAMNRAYKTPFREQVKVETDNVAVEILVDCSGSMRMDRKDKVARLAIYSMAKALQNLEINFEVTGFTTNHSWAARDTLDNSFSRSGEGLSHFIFKGWDNSSLDGISNIRGSNHNIDGESLRWAASRLTEQKQKRKVLFVFSDGYPEAENSEGAVLQKDLARSIKVVKDSGIEVVGVGILSGWVENYYPENVVIYDIDDLPKKAMKFLGEILLKGKK